MARVFRPPPPTGRPSERAAFESQALARAGAWQDATIAFSRASYRSKIGLWLYCFSVGLLGAHGTVWSATSQQALMFISFFRSAASADEYLKAVRWLYTRCDRPLGFGGFSWESPAVAQALRGGKKLEARSCKPKLALDWEDTAALVSEAERARDPSVALGFRFASGFLLRVRSEMVPIMYSDLRYRPASESARGAEALGIVLARRKNRPQGSTLWRECLCRKRPHLCVLHWTLALLAARGVQSIEAAQGCEARLFPWSYDYFLKRLRTYAQCAGLAEAARRSSREFRRGTARELLRAGAALSVVLQSGEWTSGAYRRYIDANEVDQLALFDSIEALSDDDQAEPAPARKRPAPASAKAKAKAKAKRR